MEAGSLPPAIGSASRISATRPGGAVGTFDASTLVEKTGGRLPPNFVVTLPKIICLDQVSTR
jgi:hypothetical protein